MKQQFEDSSIGVQQRILWIDGVGGFLLVDRDEVTIGQAISQTCVDVRIVGDLSRQAAVIRRSEGDYVLQPLQATRLNDLPIERVQLLHDGDLIQFGSRVKLKFSKPNPLSGTARLDLLSFSRFKPHVDAILLLADSCILGTMPGSHVDCSNWSSELLLYHASEGWCFRLQGEVEVDGKIRSGRIPLSAGLRIRGEDFSLSVE